MEIRLRLILVDSYHHFLDALQKAELDTKNHNVSDTSG